MSHAAIIPALRPWPEPITPESVAGRRYYACPDGQRRVSITTVEKALGLGSEALIGWAAKTEKAATLEAVKAVYEWAKQSTPAAFIDMVEKRIGKEKAHLAAMNKAADIGTATHQMIQWRLRGECGLPPGDEPKLSDQATVAYMAWDDWYKAADLKPVRVEQVVWDDELGVAGQLDLIAEAPDGVLELWDWKSSNYIVPKHHIQVAQYLRMARMIRPVRRAFILRVPKSIDDIRIEVKPLGDIYDFDTRRTIRRTEAQLLEAFRGALAIYRTMMEIEA